MFGVDEGFWGLRKSPLPFYVMFCWDPVSKEPWRRAKDAPWARGPGKSNSEREPPGEMRILLEKDRLIETGASLWPPL